VGQFTTIGAALGALTSHSSGPHPPDDHALKATLASAHLAPASDTGSCPHLKSIQGIRVPVVCYRALTYRPMTDQAKRMLIESIAQALTSSNWQVSCQLVTEGTTTRVVLHLLGTSDNVVVGYTATTPVAVILVRQPGGFCT
jgi:hypothetical protein